MKTEIIAGKTWVVDSRNNRASVEHWGSEEKAIAALESCSDCCDCFDCYGCHGCSDCYGCHRCYDCYDCSGCYDANGKFTVPVVEDIHRKVFDAASVEGALDMRNWHACETTHCRAGWVIHLAGEAGYALEKQTSPVFAAMQIYKASGYGISPCRFFDDNDAAMEDMRRLALLPK